MSHLLEATGRYQSKRRTSTKPLEGDRRYHFERRTNTKALCGQVGILACSCINLDDMETTFLFPNASIEGTNAVDSERTLLIVKLSEVIDGMDLSIACL